MKYAWVVWVGMGGEYYAGKKREAFVCMGVCVNKQHSQKGPSYERPFFFCIISIWSECLNVVGARVYGSSSLLFVPANDHFSGEEKRRVWTN